MTLTFRGRHVEVWPILWPFMANIRLFRLFVLQLHKLTSDLIFICINWFAGNLAEIAEEDEANFTQFSYTPENGESLKS